MKLTILLFVFLFLSCSSKSINYSEMSEEERLYKSNCISCHSLPDSKSKSDEQWITILDDHNNRTKISQQKINIILNYLMNNN